MPKLCQVIAIEKGAKTTKHRAITDAYHLMQKKEKFTGLARTYASANEDGEVFPDEAKRVEVRVPEVIAGCREAKRDLINVAFMKEDTNTRARVDVKIDGEVVIKDVPVGWLLFAEKQIKDEIDFIKKLPVLDPADDWSWNAAQKCFATKSYQVRKTEKQHTPIIVTVADENHPAQYEMLSKDILLGHYHVTKYSGAITKQEKSERLERAKKLQRALKFAREEANVMECERRDVGSSFLGFIWDEQVVSDVAQ